MNPTQTAAWASLNSHKKTLSKLSLEQLRQADGSRTARYAIDACNIKLDYSRHHINDETLILFEQLLNEQGWRAWQQKMFEGEAINTSENRAVLHVALRGSYTGADSALAQEVLDTQARFFGFANAVRNGEIKGHSGQSITDVVARIWGRASSATPWPTSARNHACILWPTLIRLNSHAP